MGNKTIYVSEKDEKLFEEAKTIAGEALSSVISRALREYVALRQKKSQGMKEVSVKIGNHGTEREQRFVGMEMGKWSGFSNDKEWWMDGVIYKTQKNNWAILLTTVSKASLLTNRRSWKMNGDYLIDSRKAELIVGNSLEEFKKALPEDLFNGLSSLIEKDHKPVEYLDI